MSAPRCLFVLIFFSTVSLLPAQPSDDILWVRGGQGLGEAIAALSSDRSRLVTGHHWDGWIRLWNVETRQMISAFNPDITLQGAVVDLKFSRDGSRFAAVCHDSTVRIFSGTTGTFLDSLPALRPATAVEFSATGDTLFVGDAEGEIHFVHLPSMSRIGGGRLPEFLVRYLALHPLGERLLAVSQSGRMAFVDSRTGDLRTSFPVSAGDQLHSTAHQFSIAMNDSLLFVGRTEGGLWLLDVATGDSIGFIASRAAAIDIAETGDTLFTFGPKDEWGSSGERSWMVNTWSVHTGAVISSDTVPIPDNYQILSLWRMMPDRRSHVVIASIHWGLIMVAPITIAERQWFNKPGRTEHLLLSYAPVTALRPVGNGQIAMAANSGGNYRLLDVETGEEHDAVDYYGSGSSLNLSPDGLTRIISRVTDENGSVTSAIDPGDKHFTPPLHAAYGEVAELWVCNGGALVACGYTIPYPALQYKLLLIDGKKVDTVCENATLYPGPSVAFSSGDHPLLAAARRDSSVLLYETVSRSARHTLQFAARPISLTFSSDNRLLACGRSDGIISIIDVMSGSVVGEMNGHREGVNDLQFCRGNRWLVSAGEDSTVRTWNVATLVNDYTYRGYPSGFVSVGATPDGRHILAGGDDFSLVCWRGRGEIASISETYAAVAEGGLRAVVAGDRVNLSFRLNRPAAVTIELYNAVGQLVRAERGEYEAGDIRAWIKTDDLPSGAYWVHLRSDEGVASCSIILRH